MPVAKQSRTVAPGASRIRWRRLTIGSSTMPVVPDSARPSSADGVGRCRGRGRGTARDRFPIRPAPAAGPRGSARGTPTRPARADRAAGDGRAARRCRRRYSVSRNSLPNAGCARSSAADVEHDLGVAGDVDLADARAVIAHRRRGAPRRRLRSRRRCRAASTMSSSRRRKRRAVGRKRRRRSRPARAAIG